MLDPYLPLVLLFALAGAFALFSVTAAPYIGPQRYNRAKLDCLRVRHRAVAPAGRRRRPHAGRVLPDGDAVHPVRHRDGLPLPVRGQRRGARGLGLFGLVEIVLFIVTVGFAYVYVWRRGGLDWN